MSGGVDTLFQSLSDHTDGHSLFLGFLLFWQLHTYLTSEGFSVANATIIRDRQTGVYAIKKLGGPQILTAFPVRHV